MPRLGIVGYANTGKTTLFNALTGQSALAAPHPFSTSEPNFGTVAVPDDLLAAAARLEGSAKVVPATFDIVDLPSLPSDHPSASDLARLQTMDAFVIVLRAFDDPAIPAGHGGTDPSTQADELVLAMAVADHSAMARRAERVAKEASSDTAKRPLAATLRELAAYLSEGAPLRAREWPPEAGAVLRDSSPLTLKPVVWVVNVAETDITPRVIPAVGDDPVVTICARLEEEAAHLRGDDRAELYEAFGLGEGAASQMVHAAYRSLRLITFYTVGPKESRAWTLRAGSTAQEAAGRIHSDLERGFIRSEVASVEAVIAAGGWDQAKKAGLVRVEGRSYQVADGDVMLVRFSV
jgi:GTP-binding protein YchF